VYVRGAATVADSTFQGNQTGDGDGAGLYLTGDGPFEIHRSTFAGNVATGFEASGGGLLLASGEQALILNCTFSGNASGDQGGGLYAASDTKVWSTTFSGNASVNEGGAMYNASTIRVANTIIAASPNGGNCGGNDFISGNRNIDTDGTCELDGPSDQEGVDPLLGPLADNGGASPTHSIGGNSPAVDVGNASICPEVDQRGLPRPADGNGDGNAVCDIGAYEFFDQCPGDPNKIDPGACGCGNVETDDNANGIVDCLVNAEVKARIARAHAGPRLARRPAKRRGGRPPRRPEGHRRRAAPVRPRPHGRALPHRPERQPEEASEGDQEVRARRAARTRRRARRRPREGRDGARGARSGHRGRIASAPRRVGGACAAARRGGAEPVEYEVE
jgi:hypothetical protein